MCFLSGKSFLSRVMRTSYSLSLPSSLKPRSPRMLQFAEMGQSLARGLRLHPLLPSYLFECHFLQEAFSATQNLFRCPALGPPAPIMALSCSSIISCSASVISACVHHRDRYFVCPHPCHNFRAQHVLSTQQAFNKCCGKGGRSKISTGLSSPP